MSDREWLVKAILSTLKRLSMGELAHVYRIARAYAERAKNSL